jgi:hypothetical protein
MWVDGSVKIVFSPDRAGEVLDSFRQHLKAFEIAKGMLDNPPKKCVGCRGVGQLMVKKGDTKEAVVCPKCSGSGRMNFIPPNVGTVGHAPSQRLPDPTIGITSLPSLTDDEPPTVALPHQSLTPMDLDADLLPQMQKLLAKHGYKVTPLTKEETAEQLAEMTAANGEHPETERPPVEAEPESQPILSLEELAALGKPATS